jgi:hypothetical protein
VHDVLPLFITFYFPVSLCSIQYFCLFVTKLICAVHGIQLDLKEVTR